LSVEKDLAEPALNPRQGPIVGEGGLAQAVGSPAEAGQGGKPLRLVHDPILEHAPRPPLPRGLADGGPARTQSAAERPAGPEKAPPRKAAPPRTGAGGPQISLAVVEGEASIAARAAGLERDERIRLKAQIVRLLASRGLAAGAIRLNGQDVLPQSSREENK
jgi:hypothetical protein